MVAVSCFSSTEADGIAIELVEQANYCQWLAKQTTEIKAQLESVHFQPEVGSVNTLFDQNFNLSKVLVIYCAQDSHKSRLANCPDKVPSGYNYMLVDKVQQPEIYIGWAMACYNYLKPSCNKTLFIPETLRKEVLLRTEAIYHTRTLINNPANQLTTQVFEQCIESHFCPLGAKVNSIVGTDALNAANFPAIACVGKASQQAPRLVELNWGDETNPKITLIGKGVIFDSGGLNIKPDSGMRLMKKDMGGAANIYGLAHAIINLQLPIRLQVLLPIVENAISANAMRPGDVITMRSGLTVEIDNTDAEGRLILADAVTYATEAQVPELMITMATLTGAARVAVGTEIAAFFCNNHPLSQQIVKCAETADDPAWQLPLYQPYLRSLDSECADLKNTGYSMGGAITAALFLEKAIMRSTNWLHFDIMAWNDNVRSGHPKGGEAMGIEAILCYLRQTYS